MGVTDPAVTNHRLLPTMLDELLSSGEVVWAGHGRIGGADGLISLHPADIAPVTLAPPTDIDTTAVHDRLREILAPGGALRFGQLTEHLDTSESETETALWDLVWAGEISNDSFVPVRALLSPRRTATQRAATPAHRGRAAHRACERLACRRDTLANSHSRPASPTAGGRWYLAVRHPRHGSRQHCSHPDRLRAVAEPLRCGHQGQRHDRGRRGRVLPDLQGAARLRGQRSGPARLLRRRSGRCAVRQSATVDELRSHTDDDQSKKAPEAVVLAACDPANPYGAALV